MGTNHALPAGIRIRSIRPADLDALEDFYAGLSRDSTIARFHGASCGIAEPAARRFCGPDHAHREGFVAVPRQSRGRDEVIGHLCLEPTDTGDVELAVAVADAWQHHGIGHALVVAAIDWAATHGIARVRARIRWSNPAIVGLLRSIPRPMTFVATDDDLEAVIYTAGNVPVAA